MVCADCNRKARAAFHIPFNFNFNFFFFVTLSTFSEDLGFITMKAKLIVFPIRGRNWCFSRSVDHSLPPPSSTASSQSPSSFKELWNNVNNAEKSFNAKAELCTDYVADKVEFSSFLYSFLSVSRFLDIAVLAWYCYRWIMAGLLWKEHLTDLWKRRFTGQFSVLLRNFLVNYCSRSWNVIVFL